jgi:ATP-dependent DNA helicase RecQ
VITALNYLEERGHLKLQVAGVRQGYRRAKAVEDLTAIIEKINGRFADREARDAARIQQILKFVVCEGCRTGELLRYFGEERKNGDGKCGHCDRCEGQPVGRLPVTHRHALAEREEKVVERLRGERHKALAEPRQVARFLCGLTSPKASRERLSRHPMFGAWAGRPFCEVLEFVEQH